MTSETSATAVTVVRGKWYPAAVVLRDTNGGIANTWRKAHVVLAEGGDHPGLWIYTRPDEVAWRGAVNWQRQGDIPTGRKAKTGIEVQLTDGGIAVITPGTQCRCGALGRWAGPEWAYRVGVRS